MRMSFVVCRAKEGYDGMIRREYTKIDGSVCTTREDKATKVNDNLN